MDNELLEPGLKSNLGAYQSERTANAFLESVAFDRAVKLKTNTTGHAQFLQGSDGTDTIILSGDNEKQQILNSTSRMQVDGHGDKTTLSADLESKNGYSRRSIQIDMDPSHNETVVLRDGSDSTMIKSKGSWTPGDNNVSVGNFELTRGGEPVAKVIGRRELQGDLEKTHYTLYQPVEFGKQFSTIDIDKKTKDGIVDVNMKFETNR